MIKYYSFSKDGQIDICFVYKFYPRRGNENKMIRKDIKVKSVLYSSLSRHVSRCNQTLYIYIKVKTLDIYIYIYILYTIQRPYP